MFGIRSVASDPIGFGQRLEILIGNQAGILVNRDVALTVGWMPLNAQYLALAFHIDILTRWNVAQLVRCANFSWNIPHPPQGTIFGAQPPKGEGLDAKALRGPHLVKRCDRIQKPNVVLQIALIQIAQMRI